MTMAGLAEQLPRMANAYVTSSVMDSTGLKGSWDFELKWTGRARLAEAGSAGISMFDAVDKQLGLKLEPKMLPNPVIVVDSVNQKPSANPPGVITSLPPPPPAEFEVAEIKPSAPDAKEQGIRFQPSGRLDAQNIPLRDLIELAWDINSEDMIAAPKWMESAKFDIIAKAVTVLGGTEKAPSIDFEALQQMLRNLLIDRFKLVTHMEDRPISAYTLVPAKPKLKKADPLNRTGCKQGPAPAAKDPRDTNPALSRLFTCLNVTMAQFADQLQGIAPGYIHSPVLDATGIEGAYDLTIAFSPAGAFNGGPGGRGGDAAPAAAAAAGGASDPNGALTVLEAINKQLGLKLELQKRPVPVLVVDRANETPTDN